MSMDDEYHQLSRQKTELLRKCKEYHQQYLSKLNLNEPDLNDIIQPFSSKMSDIHTKLYQLQFSESSNKDETKKEISSLKQQLLQTQISMNKALIQETRNFFDKDKSLVLTKNELSIKMNFATKSYQIAIARVNKQYEIEKAKEKNDLALIASLSNELTKIETEMSKPLVDVKLENDTNKAWQIWKKSIMEQPTILSGIGFCFFFFVYFCFFRSLYFACFVLFVCWETKGILLCLSIKLQLKDIMRLIVKIVKK